MRMERRETTKTRSVRRFGVLYVLNSSCTPEECLGYGLVAPVPYSWVRTLASHNEVRHLKS